jgi:hypothetical protein
MNRATMIERALSQVDLGTKYAMGGGDLAPVDDSVRDAKGYSDCSAFVCWALGIPRRSPFEWTRKLNGGWYNTSAIWWDAIKEASGYFRPAPRIEPGVVLVYPAASLLARAGFSIEGFAANDPAFKHPPRIGHCGIVVAGTSLETARVVHCSAGNFKRSGDAIQVTGPKVFHVLGVIAAWPSILEG